MTFYDRLEPLMISQKLSQKEIAQIAGIKPPSVNEWKTKGTIPRADVIIKLAKRLGTTVEYLVTGKDDSAISSEEQTLLSQFRQLDERDKADIMGIIKMKLDYGKKTLLYPTRGTHNLERLKGIGLYYDIL